MHAVVGSLNVVGVGGCQRAHDDTMDRLDGWLYQLITEMG